MTARSSILPPAPTPTLPDLYRAAATAIEALSATLSDCAREVETRSGQRVARDRLRQCKYDARKALVRIYQSVPLMMATAIEIGDMREGCTFGFVRPTWALRLMQLAADAPEPRDTVPAGAPTCPGCRGVGRHFDAEDGSWRKCLDCTGTGTDLEAPEEHAGEGGT